MGSIRSIAGAAILAIGALVIGGAASQAATIILEGIAKGKARILIGKDARSIDRLTRLFPSSYEKQVLKRIDNPALFDE